MTAAKIRKVHKQHHVARFYLEAWATNGQLSCLRDNRIFSTNVRDAAVERHFYRGRRLTPDDVAMVRLWIKKSPPQAVDAHRTFMTMFSTWAELRATLPEDLAAVPGIVDQLDAQVLNAEEDFHGAIENHAAPMIDAARRGDLSFYGDSGRCIHFMHYLALQLFRTRAVKEKTFRLQAEQGGVDLSNCWNIISHITAANVGLTLFLERAKRPLIRLEAPPGAEFITGDQPILNVLHGHSVEAYGLYYPISPKVALVLGDPVVPLPFEAGRVTAEAVRRLNDRIAGMSFEQLFAASPQALEPYLTVGQPPIDQASTSAGS